MQIKEAYQELRTVLSGIYPAREAAVIADLVMEEITGWERSRRIMHHDDELSNSQEQRYHDCKTELLHGRPVQYVLGHTWFAGMRLKVDERVLIPRPETEELVETIKKIHKEVPTDASYQIRLLDIGTGSGCIAIALKRYFQEWNISAMDKSRSALELAKYNADLMGTEIHFMEADILVEALSDSKPSFDIIVSNPPYIPEDDKKEMDIHVFAYEPHMALFTAHEDPLVFYKAIVSFAEHHLLRGGMLFFETHEAYAQQVADWLSSHEFESVNILQDMQGKERIVYGTRLGASL